MTRSESFLLKVQGTELDVDRMSWSEAANADGDRGVEGGRCLEASIRSAKPWKPFEFRAVRLGISWKPFLDVNGF